MERLADAERTDEIEATAVYCVIADPDGPRIWPAPAAGHGTAAPPGLAEDGTDGRERDHDHR